MKTFCLLLFSISNCLAQAVASDDRAADKQTLRDLGAQYEAAINQGKFSSLAHFVTPNASAVFMTGAELVGLDAMQKYFDDIKAKLGAGSTYTVKLIPDDTDFYGDTAVAHGRSDESVVLGNGTKLAYQTQWTAVLHKTNGSWQASRLHVSLDPIENPIIALKAKTSQWLNLGVGGVVGLVIGLVVRRKKARSH